MCSVLDETLLYHTHTNMIPSLLPACSNEVLCASCEQGKSESGTKSLFISHSVKHTQRGSKVGATVQSIRNPMMFQ